MNESTSVDQAAASELTSSSVCPAESAGEHNEEKSTLRKPILFFDGVCGLCNSSVDFAIARDKNSRLLYTPLQGETAKQLLSEDQIHNIATVIFRTEDGKHLYRRSAAIVRLLWLLGFPWNICGWTLWIIPLPIRDLGYRIIAGLRYRLFEKHATCRMPTLEERARFLP
ncbi:DCC1-like thiol-disulfide oxidoreductase family protein [uncultured Gimesia sp.]|uniref:thiol-disulfide oxidoreductase DCC family protein n=1 Tax=uncultured Gimesia sp. TaxID=1678688 RepID=UPI0026288DA0|nr:DCC1-like thiol-disulfide oxidoreductase family protein [uncultured Gimesia sp.]